MEKVALELEGSGSDINFTHQGFRKIETQLLTETMIKKLLEEEVKSVKGYSNVKLHRYFFQKPLTRLNATLGCYRERIESLKKATLAVP